MKENKNRPGPRRIFLYVGVPLALLFVVVGAWFVYAELSSRSGINFNHAFHEEIGASCDLCHQVSDSDPRLVSFPDHETCSACHFDAIDEASQDKNCELCHNLPGYESRVRKNQVLSPLVRFDHRLHEGAGVSCDACHTVPEQPFLVGDEMLPKMEPVCIECHARQQVADVEDCSTCHLAGWQKIAPPDHAQNWLVLHSQDLTKDKFDTVCLVCHTEELDNSCTECHHREGARAAKTQNCALCHGKGYESRQPANHGPLWVSAHGKNLTQSRIDTNCTLCHTARDGNDCQECHRREAPRNHNTAFTAMGHGKIARLDRQSCATCHDQSECISCHTTNPPSSHTGLWGAPRSRHCINCHMERDNYASGAVGSNCSFCHQSADVYASHQSVPRPVPHAADSCTNCHRLSGGLPNTNIPHPYPGIAANIKCLSCHL